jgi:transposase
MKHKRHEKTKKAICGPTQGNWQQMNRKQRREMTRKIQSEDISLEVIHPDAAGMDIGNESHYVAGEKRKDRLQKKGNQPQFDLQQQLFRMTGTDVTRIDGIDVMTATTILSEVGWDMSKWETEDHFVSWLRLAPDNRISGDKIIGKGRLPTNNRVSTALKMAASTLRTSQTYLGAQFRRLRARLDTPVAIKAMAAKLARLVYRMLRYGMQYLDQGAVFYEAQHRLSQIKQLKWKAHKLGFRIVQSPAA